MKSKTTMLTAVDLFAGGGGLTVGLKKAGFEVISAVEVESHAFNTYKANHPEVHAIQEDIRHIKGEDIKTLSPTGNIDLLAGCPPCQGFSTLTLKYRRFDPRNELINEMGRLVKEIRPSCVMMENVPGLVRKGMPLFKNFINMLRRNGYKVEWEVLQVADYGVPQNRRRLVLLASKKNRIKMPKPTHSRTGEGGRMPWKVLREVIHGMPSPITLSEACKSDGPQSYNWHVTRNISRQNLERLKHTKPGQGRYKLPDEIRPECHKGSDKGFVNVYGRLAWDQISATITGGCTTLSKGRFGHPDEDRTLSVREAALIQTFPEGYILDTPYMDYACNIVGNALPCDFAYAVARQCYDTLINV